MFSTSAAPSESAKVRQRHRAVALGEPAPCHIHRERHVGVVRRIMSQQRRQERLVDRGRQQVLAADDLIDPCFGVIDDNGEVVRRHTVVAPNHEVVDRPGYLTME